MPLVRITQEVYDQCKLLAEKDRRSLAGYINNLLAETIDMSYEMELLQPAPTGQTCPKGHYYKGAKCLQPECQ